MELIAIGFGILIVALAGHAYVQHVRLHNIHIRTERLEAHNACCVAELSLLSPDPEHFLRDLNEFNEELIQAWLARRERINGSRGMKSA